MENQNAIFDPKTTTEIESALELLDVFQLWATNWDQLSWIENKRQELCFLHYHAKKS
jgi:hypothetical protein